jgi:CDP-diglyceride synthetase
MFVLKIIGLLLAIFTIAVLVNMTNRYTEKKYGHEFFSLETYGVSAVGYVALYYGYGWYQSALGKNLDILNGQIIMGLSLVLILGVIYYNAKKTSLGISLILSIFQQALYAALAVVGFWALLVMIGYFMQTKPVFNVNGR